MKMLNNQIIVVIIFLTSPHIVSHVKPNENVNKIIKVEGKKYLVDEGNTGVVVDINPFLIEKRHGVLDLIDRYPKDKFIYKKLVAEKNPFLVEKRHGSVLKINDILNDQYNNENLVVERNPFLVEKHRGAFLTVKTNAQHIYKINIRVNVRNIFLDQKRHQ